MDAESLRLLKELEAKHEARKNIGLPKYDEATLVGYVQYLKRTGLSDDEIKKVIEQARKE